MSPVDGTSDNGERQGPTYSSMAGVSQRSQTSRPSPAKVLRAAVLNPTEVLAVAEQFGVADARVRRDHLLSQLLAALASNLAEEVVFLGGAALARTHLPDGRLGENLDLVARGKRASVASVVERVLATGARRDYGRLSWQPRFVRRRGRRSCELVALRLPSACSVDATGVPRVPTPKKRQLLQALPDTPPTMLRVPPLASFVARKTVAWADRRCHVISTTLGAARLGAIDEAAATCM